MQPSTGVFFHRIAEFSPRVELCIHFILGFLSNKISLCFESLQVIVPAMDTMAVFLCGGHNVSMNVSKFWNFLGLENMVNDNLLNVSSWTI